MMVRGSLPSLIQGISQQSPSIRPKDYIEDGVNLLPSIIEGLGRRPGSDHVANIAPMTDPKAVHWIVRDSGERYFVAVEDGELRVWDFEGTLQEVNADDGWDYVTAALAEDTPSIGFTTVNDYTFVYDRNRVVEMEEAAQPAMEHGGHVWVRQGDYATTYTIRVGYPAVGPTWYAGSYTTSASSSADIRIANIRAQLESALAGALPGGFTITSADHVLYVTRGDNADFLLEVIDDATSKNMIAVKDSVAGITDLPTVATNGIMIKIRGDAGNPRDDWWAKFVTTGAGFGSGYWQECPKPETPITLDADTMPHLLVREEDGTFTFREADYGDRVSGGEEFNPGPSFVGKTIQHVGAEKGRISFKGAGYYTATRAGDLFNFWQQSVQVLQDSDPIDISPSFPKPYVLTASAEFQRGLVLFADNVQFIVRAGDIFGPKTIAADPLSGYSLDPLKGFLGLQQDRILCALKRDRVTGLQTFKASSASAGDIVFDETSAVVPTLISGSTEWIAGSDTENVVAQKGSGSNRVFLYKEAMDGGKVIQSAWVPWEFKGREPISGKFIGPNLYVLLKDSADNFSLEHVSLLPFSSNQLPWDIALDRRVELEPEAFEASGGTTVVQLPWTPTEDESVYLVITEGDRAGLVERAVTVVGDVATFVGLHTGPGVVGVSCRSTATLSTLYFRRPTSSGGEETVSEGTLQILRATVSYSDSGPFQVSVKPTDRPDPFVENVAVPRFEDGGFTGPQTLQTGSTEFPVGAMNDRVSITFDSGEGPMPMRIASFEWKGDLNLQARPV